MNDKLYIACVIFFIIDLSLVGTTCIAVSLLVRKMMKGEIKIRIAEDKKRNFIEMGK